MIMHLIVGPKCSGKSTFAASREWTVLYGPVTNADQGLIQSGGPLAADVNDQVDYNYLRSREFLDRFIMFRHTNPKENDTTCIIVNHYKDVPPVIRRNCTVWVNNSLRAWQWQIVPMNGLESVRT